MLLCSGPSALIRDSACSHVRYLTGLPTEVSSNNLLPCCSEWSAAGSLLLGLLRILPAEAAALALLRLSSSAGRPAGRSRAQAPDICLTISTCELLLQSLLQHHVVWQTSAGALVLQVLLWHSVSGQASTGAWHGGTDRCDAPICVCCRGSSVCCLAVPSRQRLLSPAVFLGSSKHV